MADDLDDLVIRLWRTEGEIQQKLKSEFHHVVHVCEKISRDNPLKKVKNISEDLFLGFNHLKKKAIVILSGAAREGGWGWVNERIKKENVYNFKNDENIVI